MKTIIGYLIMIVGIVLGLYVGGWMMFISPIIEACKAFDAGTLTALKVGLTIIKCVFASTVGVIIAYIGLIVGNIVVIGDYT